MGPVTTSLHMTSVPTRYLTVVRGVDSPFAAKFARLYALHAKHMQSGGGRLVGSVELCTCVSWDV